ncbi:Histone deacetylase hda1 [Cryptotrichosporon argae]
MDVDATEPAPPAPAVPDAPAAADAPEAPVAPSAVATSAVPDAPAASAAPAAAAASSEPAPAPVLEPEPIAASAMDIDPATDGPVSTAPARAEGSTTVVFPQAAPAPDVFTAEPANAAASSSAPMALANGQAASPTPVDPSQSGALLAPTADAEEPPVERRRIARTGYVYDPLMMLHCQDGYTPTEDHVEDNGEGHPEEPMRIKRIFKRLRESNLIQRMKQLPSKEVTRDQVILVHTEDHWDKVQGLEMLTDEYIQESKQYFEQLSLYVCRETAHCARLSCGGTIEACMAVCKGEVRNAFAIVRPPGHHAEPDEHMGFCFFNNVAVAAREVMREGLAKKVLILDWDVHHGNGTQRAFYDDGDVLYISLHRHDGGRFYPTSDFGALDVVGEGKGEGKSVNIPWPCGGFGDADYIYAFQKIVMPIAYEFAPDLVIISAGFDAADGDQLGGCNVTPAGYGHMTHMLCALAGGKVVVALEGGYNLRAISDSSLAVAQVLLGETPEELGPLEASELATEVVYQVAQVQSKYWKSINVPACEPTEASALEDGASPTVSIPDLLKIYRAHHLFSKYGLYQIPLASEELEEAFGGQVICNEDVYSAGESSTLVVFVHDFGNLRVETDGVSTTDIHMTNSYLLDTSDTIVQWVLGNGYNLIDVNILKQIPTRFASTGPKQIIKEGPKAEGQLIRYLWDNYIELSEAENVVLIGHGTACNVVMDLVNNREVERKVKAVVQVAGLHSIVRISPTNDSRRAWFRQNNQIYVPQEHILLDDETVKRRLGGHVMTSDKSRVVDVLQDVLPQIKEFVASRVPAPKPAETSQANGVHAAAVVAAA